MVKSCIYCKTGLDESFVVDVCKRCGIGVWGEKMFDAIISNMESARDAGDLYQGSVTDEKVGDGRSEGLKSITEEALVEQEKQQSPEVLEERIEQLEIEQAKPTREDIPPLIEPEPLVVEPMHIHVESGEIKPESLGPENELEVLAETAQPDKVEDATFIIDNLEKEF